jgi:1-acyl-sn-glycerol-3-phosphate acyltransferase
MLAELDPAAARSPRLIGVFSWWMRRYLPRHFHALRLSRAGRPRVTGDPLLIVLNHPSWWDPLVCLILSQLFTNYIHFAPIDAAALNRYGFFRRLGFYPVELGSPRGAITFLRTTTQLLSRPGVAVWLTAQGRFVDPRIRPPGLRGGVGHLVHRLANASVLPLAIEYPFWDERLPEVLTRFGDPMPVGGGNPTEWTERIEAALAATQDALAAEAQARDREAFDVLLRGRSGVGGVYDWWRRLRARLRHEPFDPAHSPEDRQ